jgi:hypothetical protein
MLNKLDQREQKLQEESTTSHQEQEKKYCGTREEEKEEQKMEEEGMDEGEEEEEDKEQESPSRMSSLPLLLILSKVGINSEDIHVKNVKITVLLCCYCLDIFFFF